MFRDRELSGIFRRFPALRAALYNFCSGSESNSSELQHSSAWIERVLGLVGVKGADRDRDRGRKRERG